MCVVCVIEVTSVCENSAVSFENGAWQPKISKLIYAAPGKISPTIFIQVSVYF